MGSRSERLAPAAALAVALALALSVAPLASCRLQLDEIRHGGAWTAADYAEIVVGEDDRGDVLARLGPPDEVLYTLGDEVFLYRIGAHRGSALRFFIPDVSFSFGRPGMEYVGPEPEQALDVPVEPFLMRMLRGLVEYAVGFAVPGTSEDALALEGRRLRYDVVRVVLDRGTHVTRSKELLRGVRQADFERLLAETFLLGEEAD